MDTHHLLTVFSVFYAFFPVLHLMNCLKIIKFHHDYS
uniref:Uncharacterized protein n=1 Tax=Rhizophora mucronata TaxID=61149 RepID=A0A2P2N1F2_RHIMU